MGFDGEIDDFDDTELEGFDEGLDLDFPGDDADMMEEEEEALVEDEGVATSRAGANEGPFTRHLRAAA